MENRSKITVKMLGRRLERGGDFVPGLPRGALKRLAGLGKLGA